MPEFEIGDLDHIAIKVKDLKASAEWYASVLGLKPLQFPEWGEYPIFMLANTSGVALFPENLSDSELEKAPRNLKIDHFAFNVTGDNFEKAKAKFEAIRLDYTIENHHYFKSLYITDLDGHTVELTTLIVDKNLFYK